MTNEQRKTAIEWLQEEIRSLRLAPKINGCGPENWADLMEIMETCLEAVRGHGYEPLTLEQLREMDGRLVYNQIRQKWYVIDEVFVKGNLKNGNCNYAQVTMSDGEIFCRDLDYDEISGRFYAYNSELLSSARKNEVKPMRLIDAPVGLLECDGTIILKTEYMMQSDDGSEAPECYIVETGEYFCGGVETAEELKNLEVKPVCFNASAPAEILEAIDGLIEFARERMSITEWLYYVNIIGPWRGEKEEVISEHTKEFEKYPCKHRNQDGFCGRCAFICECKIPSLCEEREE